MNAENVSPAYKANPRPEHAKLASLLRAEFEMMLADTDNGEAQECIREYLPYCDSVTCGNDLEPLYEAHKVIGILWPEILIKAALRRKEGQASPYACPVMTRAMSELSRIERDIDECLREITGTNDAHDLIKLEALGKLRHALQMQQNKVCFLLKANEPGFKA